MALRRACDHCFQTSRRRNQEMSGDKRRIFGLMIGERQSIKRYDLKRLAIDLQIQVAIR